MINLNIKQLFWLIFVVLSISFLSFFAFKTIMDMYLADINWIGAFLGAVGNVLGGLMGGLVAYLVASHQVSHALKSEKEKQKQTTITMLKLIREELKDNVGFIESADIDDSKDFLLLKTQLSDDTWKSTMINLNIDDNLIVKLNVCYRKISLIKSLEQDDIDNDFLNEIKQQIENTIIEINNSLTDKKP